MNMNIEQTATQYPGLQRSACAVVAKLMEARGVVNSWDLAYAIADVTGNDISHDAVRNAVARARKAGAKIKTRAGIGYQISMDA